VDQQYLDREVDEEAVEARRRMELYRGSSDPPNVAGATVVIVDDGIATGGTARAAAGYAKRLGAARVILAVPVAPQDLEERLGEEVDEIVVLEQPFMFMAVGQFYADFHQVSDDEVLALLAEARAGQEGKGG
jgi:putative phosphoribosyl transferase